MQAAYGDSLPTTAGKVMQDMRASQQAQGAAVAAEAQKAAIAGRLLSGQATADDYRNAGQGLEMALKQLNQNYQFFGANYLRMAAGAKSPQEARARIGQ